MGGLAFAVSKNGLEPLMTPRMPPYVYFAVKEQCASILRKHFEHVEAPFEAAGKLDYGDIDLVVAGPRRVVVVGGAVDAASSAIDNTRKILADALGAVRIINGSGGETDPLFNLAIPWPENSVGEKQNTAIAKPSTPSPSNAVENDSLFIQVDVQICPDRRQLEWLLFRESHGDMGIILGWLTRPLGLTHNNRALFLRIAEIEKLDKKKSMVFLTSSPVEMLRFLGLDVDRWYRAFESEAALFEYAATCRFFSVAAKKEQPQERPREQEETGEKEGGEIESMRRRDRRNLRMRPMFRHWIEEFVPKCREDGRFSSEQMSRDDTMNAAFETFGAREDYEGKLLQWRKERQRDDIFRRVIKAEFPAECTDVNIRGLAMKALKAIILEDDHSFGVVFPEAGKTEDGLYDMAAVGKFVQQNWKEVGKAALAERKAKNSARQKDASKSE